MVIKIYTRKEWGANPVKRTPSKIKEVKGLAVHWSAFPKPNNVQEEINQVRRIQDLHQNDRGSNDIAYSFLVGDSGNVYVGRGMKNRTASQGGRSRSQINYNNAYYLSVCWLGGAKNTDAPSKEAVNSVKELWNEIGGELLPHSYFKNTECCGDAWRTLIDNDLEFDDKTEENIKNIAVERDLYNWSKGDKGKDVQRIQLMLNAVPNLLNRKLVEDGIFGSKTEAAVILFQKEFFKNQYEPDASVGVITYCKLLEEYIKIIS